jgi:hypothetical protein
VEDADGLAGATVRLQARVEKQPVGQAPGAADGGRLEGADPDRDGTLHRQRVDAGIVHAIEAALEAHPR